MEDESSYSNLGSTPRQNMQLLVAQVLMFGDSGGEQVQARIIEIISQSQWVKTVHFLYSPWQ